MNIAIIGLGLIGGSLAKTLITRTDHKIFAYDRDEEVMLKGKLLNIYNEELTDDNIGSVDIMFIALYPKATIDYINKNASKLKDGAVVLDCCGNKRDVCDCFSELKNKYEKLDFVGFHPMAGREFWGIKHSVSGLYDNASAIIIPVRTELNALLKVKEIFASLGFKGVVITTAEEHDSMISYTSQLAHVVSSAYVNNEKAKNHYGFSAGSFNDLTRVAKLNSEMWTELMLENKTNLTHDLSVLIGNLENFNNAIKEEDSEKLKQLLEKGTDMKLEILAAKERKLNEKFHK